MFCPGLWLISLEMLGLATKTANHVISWKDFMAQDQYGNPSCFVELWKYPFSSLLSTNYLGFADCNHVDLLVDVCLSAVFWYEQMWESGVPKRSRACGDTHLLSNKPGQRAPRPLITNTFYTQQLMWRTGTRYLSLMSRVVCQAHSRRQSRQFV